MKTRTFATLLTLGMALLLAGCHASRRVPQVPATAPVAEETMTPKRAYTVINFEGTVEGINLTGQLRVAEDSVMWVSANKVFELGRALCTPDSLWLRAPMMGRDYAMNYTDLQRMTKVSITYDEMQETVLAPDAEERLAALARRLGLRATMRFTQRRQVDSLTFPFTKPTTP